MLAANSLVLMISCLVFYFIGRYSVSQDRPTISQVVKDVKKKLKPKIKPGVIPFKTPEDFQRERDGDKALEDEWYRSGKAEILNK